MENVNLEYENRSELNFEGIAARARLGRRDDKRRDRRTNGFHLFDLWREWRRQRSTV